MPTHTSIIDQVIKNQQRETRSNFTQFKLSPTHSPKPNWQTERVSKYFTTRLTTYDNTQQVFFVRKTTSKKVPHRVPILYGTAVHRAKFDLEAMGNEK